MKRTATATAILLATLAAPALAADRYAPVELYPSVEDTLVPGGIPMLFALFPKRQRAVLESAYRPSVRIRQIVAGGLFGTTMIRAVEQTPHGYRIVARTAPPAIAEDCNVTIDSGLAETLIETWRRMLAQSRYHHHRAVPPPDSETTAYSMSIDGKEVSATVVPYPKNGKVAALFEISAAMEDLCLKKSAAARNELTLRSGALLKKLREEK